MNLKGIEIWPLLAGLGLFLFGMYMLEEALKMLAGRGVKKFIRKHTVNPVKAVLSGALVAAVMQSSSMVSLLVMSFTGAGIIGLKNGIGMILGANLGTTATGWLVSLLGFKLNIEKLILPFIAIGGLGIIFLKQEKLSNISKLLMGFSFMFLGLGYMKNGFADFAQHIDFTFLEDKNPLLFVLFGLLLTAAIQSSSAAMMIFLSSLAAGVVTLNHAAYLVIGADLGTTVTAVIGTLKGNTIRKKTGWSQFFFNAFNGGLALAMMPVYFLVIREVFKVKDPLVALVSFHSLMNATAIIVILPFLNLFAKFINKVISPKEVRQAEHIAQANPAESHAAIEALEREARQFINKTLEVNSAFFHLNPTNKYANTAAMYFGLKNYEAEIVTFYVALLQIQLTEDEVTRVNSIAAAVRNTVLSAKDLKDIKHNLDELGNSAQDNFYALYEKICRNQKQFYDETMALIVHMPKPDAPEFESLKAMQKSFYKKENEELYRLFSSGGQFEVDVSSMLNMVKEINNSNEAMLRAIEALWNQSLRVN